MRAELRAPPRGRLAAAEQYHPAGARTQEHVDGVDAVRLWAVTGWLSRLSPARSRAPVRSDPKNVTPLVTESRIRWAPAAGMDGTGAGALIDRRDHPGPPIGRPVPRPCVGRAGTLSRPDAGKRALRPPVRRRWPGSTSTPASRSAADRIRRRGLRPSCWRCRRSTQALGLEVHRRHDASGWHCWV